MYQIDLVRRSMINSYHDPALRASPCLRGPVIIQRSPAFVIQVLVPYTITRDTHLRPLHQADMDFFVGWRRKRTGTGLNAPVPQVQRIGTHMISDHVTIFRIIDDFYMVIVMERILHQQTPEIEQGESGFQTIIRNTALTHIPDIARHVRNRHVIKRLVIVLNNMFPVWSKRWLDFRIPDPQRLKQFLRRIASR